MRTTGLPLVAAALALAAMPLAARGDGETSRAHVATRVSDGASAAGAAARAVGMSTVEITQLCSKYSFSNVTDDAGECSHHCAKIHYTKEYDYTSFMHCYRCCFSGAQCIPPVAGASACSGHGQCETTPATKDTPAKGKCACDRDWAGDYCERRANACPRFGPKQEICGGRGRCVNARCACDEGFSGKACEKKLCPINPKTGKECSGLKCNYATGKCGCGPLWKTPSCSVAACPEAGNGKECNGVGKCGADHRCSCDGTGYFGDACHKKQCPSDAQGRICGGSHAGHCDQNGTGKCHCRPGLTGPACAGIQCAIVNGKPCGGPKRGVCSEETGKCVCKRALWAGPNCERPACPRPSPQAQECGGSGECITVFDKVVKRKVSTCKCDATHAGKDCGRVKCPTDAHGNECSARGGRGTCDGNNGKCACSKGWEGAACDLRSCYKDEVGRTCSGHGTCDHKKGECVCAKGWKGHRCHVQACAGYDRLQPKKECSGRGECNNGGCLCTNGWKGIACSKRTCPAENGVECNLQGSCNSATGACKCNHKYRGASCEVKICMHSAKNGKECGGTGKCVAGKCKCNAGWRGHACDDKICPFANGKECNGVGVCEDGKCRCRIQYRGANCGTYYQARFGTSDSLANYNRVMTTRKAYKSQQRRADFKATVTVVKGDLYETLLTCNLANIHPSTHGAKYGNVYMRLAADGPVTAVKPASLGVAANVGFWQPITSLGVFRATASGEVSVGAEYWVGDPKLAVTFVYCSVGAYRVLSGRASFSSAPSLAIPHAGTSYAVAGRNYPAGDTSTTIDARSGDVIHVLLSCALWNAGGGTTYMRALGTGPVQTLMPGNWITSTVKAGGGWSQGVSQGVFRASSNGAITFKGDYHVGSKRGTYGGCGVSATVVNGTWSGETSAKGYSRTWTKRVVNAGSSGTTDFSTTIKVTRGDYVRAILTTNLLQRSSGTVYMRVVPTGGSATVNTVSGGNWVTTTNSGEWHPGVSQGTFKALSSGTITFAGTYHAGAGSVTYVYSNVYAEVLGPREGAENAKLKACPKVNGRACNAQGSCDWVEGKCKCNGLYDGPSCARAVCPRAVTSGKECDARGTCSKGECQCPAGWAGDACDDKLCPRSRVGAKKQCHGHGACIHGKCQCPEGWRGEACDVRACPLSKVNGKECALRGKCKLGKCACPDGWRGVACDEEVCPFAGGKECSGAGKCVSGACQCEGHRFGDACQSATVPATMTAAVDLKTTVTVKPRCETITMPHKLPGDPRRIVPLVSGTHASEAGHDASAAYVQYISDSRVRVCVAALPGGGDSGADKDARLAVAVSRPDAASGIQTGTVQVPAQEAGSMARAVCRDVRFRKAFDAVPTVQLTTAHRQVLGEGAAAPNALVQWTHKVTKVGFTACAAQPAGAAAGGHPKFSFEYVAVPDGLATEPYQTGRVSGAGWRRVGSSWCTRITFPKAFGTGRPHVFATASSSFPIAVWGEAAKDGAAGAEVCAKQVDGVAGAKWDPDALSLDWFAVASRPAALGNMGGRLTCPESMGGAECGGEAQGTCGDAGKCSCKAGWAGAACTIRDIDCPRNCGGQRGTCDRSTGTCSCIKGWAGDSCEQRA